VGVGWGGNDLLGESEHIVNLKQRRATRHTCQLRRVRLKHTAIRTSGRKSGAVVAKHFGVHSGGAHGG
jgi:hypothetical protein